MNLLKSLLIAALCGSSIVALAAAPRGKNFDRAIIVIFENTNYNDAMRQPFFKKLAHDGVLFTNFMALAHPSQGNYIALTSGSLNGVAGDGKSDLNVTNVVDLLEAKGLSWKVYAEGYPGNCFVGTSKGTYVRKHNPFISYVNIHSNPARCGNIVNADQFDKDAAAGALPNYVFFVPDINNDGHDTGVKYANNWYSSKFSGYVNDPRFMANTVLISTFDESAKGFNQIYTSIVGPGVKPGIDSTAVNTLSLLQMIEQNWSLGDLGRDDARATPIANIWQ
jgi:phospholipase C